MKINMIKGVGGSLSPADDMEAEKLKKFKNFGMYEVDIRLTRNPDFHAKVFAFFKFCFDHWAGGSEFDDEKGQFDTFRKQLTVTAGYYDEYFKFDGSVRIEPKSLSFGSMEQEEFEECYKALINASCKHIFKSCDENTYNQLLSFF